MNFTLQAGRGYISVFCATLRGIPFHFIILAHKIRKFIIIYTELCGFYDIVVGST